MAENVSEKYDNMIEYKKKHTAAATTQVIAAPPSDPDWRIVIDFLMFGGDTAATMQLLDDTNAEIDGYFWPYGANGGVVMEDVFLKGLTKGRGLRYTQVGGGNWTIICKYHYEEANLP